MTNEGYPQFVIFVVLGLGIPLAMLKPYKGFLLAVLLLTAGNFAVFNQTRTTALGPYLNLGDACLLVAIIAVLVDKLRSGEHILLPKIIAALFFVVTIAALQSLWKLGWTYETIRAYRWALQLPLTFFLGANLVNSSRRARQLVAVLLCGTILAALQHLFFAGMLWRSISLSVRDFSAVRTIAYWGGCLSSAFLLTGVIWKPPADMWKKILFLTTGVLLLTSILLNQTRSVWFATAGAAVCLLVLFKKRNRLMRIVKVGIIAVLIIFAAALVFQYLLPGIDVFDMIAARIKHLFEHDTSRVHMGTRQRAFKTEIGSWANGTLIFGRGLFFYQAIRNPEDRRLYVAFGHLGYVTYLSQLGLIGLLVYGVYLPFGIIKNGRWLWSYGGDTVIRYVGLLGTASIICLSIMFIMSSQFLSPGLESPGILYGAIWALVRSERRKINKISVVEGVI